MWAVQLKDGRAKVGESIGEEEAILKSISEFLERIDILGAQDSSGDTGKECERLGEVSSFMGRVLV